MAALSHPNIMVLHDVGRHDGVHYAVTEFLEGETLHRLSRGPLPWREAIRIGVAIADGLARQSQAAGYQVISSAQARMGNREAACTAYRAARETWLALKASGQRPAWTEGEESWFRTNMSLCAAAR